MIFAYVDDQSTQAELLDAIRNADKPYIYRRLMAVRLSSEGRNVSELSEIFQLTPQTIRKFIDAYNQGGLAQLMPHKKPGRTPRLQFTDTQWEEIIHQPPVSLDKLNTKSYNWTLQLLSEYLHLYHGVKISISHLWYILRQHKINMGRSQLKITSPDPDYIVKRDRVQTPKKKAETDQLTSDDVLAIAPGIIGPAETKAAVLIYYDETQIHWCPDTGKDYQLIGHQNQILSPGTDGVEYLLGGIVYPSGEGLYQMFERKRTMEVESLLISLCEMFCDRFIFLVWDNASTHTTQLLAPFFEAHSEMIYPVYLPTYSPWLNLIERLWRQMRAEITKNNFFATLGQTCQAVVDWLDDLSFEKFMTLMGLNPLTFVLH